MAIRLQFEADAKQAKREVASLEKSVASIDNTTKKAAKTTKLFVNAFAGLATASVGFKSISRNLDSFTRIGNRIALTTGRTKALVAQQQKLLDVSRATRTDVEATVALYSKLALNTKVSNAQAVRLTRTLQKAAQIGGSSAATNEAAITQLTQGLASGVLRGEELNSVLEGLPRIAQAIAEVLNVSVGQLRNLASEGKVTANTVEKALVGSAKKINQEFSELNSTISSSLKVAADDIAFGFNRIFSSLNRGSGGASKFIEGFGKGVSSFLRDIAVSIRVLQTNILLLKYDFKDLFTYISTFSVAGIFSGMLGGIASYSSVLGKALKPIKSFVDNVQDLFYNMFIYVIGNSIYKDMINNIVAYTPNLFKALDTIKSFGSAVGEVFEGLVNSTKQGIQFGLSAGNSFLGVLAQGLAGVLSVALLAVPFSRLLIGGGLGATLGKQIASGFMLVIGAAFGNFALRDDKGEGITGLLSQQNSILTFMSGLVGSLLDFLKGVIPGGGLVEAFNKVGGFISDNLAGILITAFTAKPMLKAFGLIGNSVNPFTSSVTGTAQTIGDIYQRRTAGPAVRGLRAEGEQLTAALAGVNESFRAERIRLDRQILNTTNDQEQLQILRLERLVNEDKYKKQIAVIQAQIAQNQKKLAVNSQLLDGAVERLRLAVQKSIAGFAKFGGAAGGIVGQFFGAGLGLKIAKDWGMNAGEAFLTTLLVSQLTAMLSAALGQAIFQVIAVGITGLLGGLFSWANVIPGIIAVATVAALRYAFSDDSWFRKIGEAIGGWIWDVEHYLRNTEFKQMGVDLADAFIEGIKERFAGSYSSDLLALMLSFWLDTPVSASPNQPNNSNRNNKVPTRDRSANISQADLDENVKRLATAIEKLAESPKVRGYAEGGSVVGIGTGTSDSIPAMLSNGEYVVRESAAKGNKSFLDYVNKTGKIPTFASGGEVDEEPGIFARLFASWKEYNERRNPSNEFTAFNTSGIDFAKYISQYSRDLFTTPAHSKLMKMLSAGYISTNPNEFVDHYYLATESIYNELRKLYEKDGVISAFSPIDYNKAYDNAYAQTILKPSYETLLEWIPDSGGGPSVLLLSKMFREAGLIGEDSKGTAGVAVSVGLPQIPSDSKDPRLAVAKAYYASLHELGHVFDHYKGSSHQLWPHQILGPQGKPFSSPSSSWNLFFTQHDLWSELSQGGEGFATMFAEQMFKADSPSAQDVFSQSVLGSLYSYLDYESGESLTSKNQIAAHMRKIGFPELLDLIADGKLDGNEEFNVLSKAISKVMFDKNAERIANGYSSLYYRLERKFENYLDVTSDIRKGYASGGSVYGAGTGTSDSIPAMLSNGEYVVRESVAKNNRGLLNYLNKTGKIPGFNSGGSVGSSDDPLTIAGYDLRELKQYLDPLIETMKEMIAPLQELVMSGVNQAMGAISGGESEGSQFKSLDELVKTLMPVLNNDGIKVKADILSGYLDDNPKDAQRVNQLQESLNRVNDRIKSLGEDVPYALELQKKVLEEDIVTELGTIVEAIEEGNDVIRKFTDRQSQAGENLLDSTKQGLAGSISDVIRGRASPEEALKGFANSFLDNVVDNLSTSFVEGLFTTKGVDGAPGEDNALAQIFTNIGSYGAKGAEDLGRGVFDKVSGALGSTVNNPMIVKDIGVAGIAGPMLTDGLELPPGVSGPVGEGAENAAATQQQGFKGIMDTLWNTTKTLLSDGFGGLKDIFGGLMNSLGSLFGGGGSGGGFMGVISTIAGAFGGGFYTGGSLGANKFGVVGERGPELITGPAKVYSNAQSARMLERAGTESQGSKNITFALEGDFDTRAERSIRRMINSGMMQSALNGAEVENGGNQPIFRTP